MGYLGDQHRYSTSFNHYKAIAYMCAYLSKSYDEFSQAIGQVLKEAFEDKLDNYQ